MKEAGPGAVALFVEPVSTREAEARESPSSRPAWATKNPAPETNPTQPKQYIQRRLKNWCVCVQVLGEGDWAEDRERKTKAAGTGEREWS